MVWQNVANMYMVGQTSGMSSPEQNKAISSYQCISSNSFQGAAHQNIDLSFWFTCGDTQKPKCIQLQLKIKRHFTDAIFMPVTSFATKPGPMKVYSSSWSYISMCVLFQVADILIICYELDLISNTD
jgi:hypothetical protein